MRRQRSEPPQPVRSRWAFRRQTQVPPRSPAASGPGRWDAPGPVRQVHARRRRTGPGPGRRARYRRPGCRSRCRGIRADACTGASRRRLDPGPAWPWRPARQSGWGTGARSGRRTRFAPMPVRPRQPATPRSRTSLELAKATARQRPPGPYRRAERSATNTGDRFGGRAVHRISAARRSRSCDRCWASGRLDRPSSDPADHRRWHGCGHRRSLCGQIGERRWPWLRATRWTNALHTKVPIMHT
jgi:hypothetical protein